MKNLKNILACAILALANVTAHAMEYTHSSVINQPLDCCLGPVCSDNHNLRQNIYVNNAMVGRIKYQDFNLDASYSRNIDSLKIDDTQQRKGFGSACMRQFIETAKEQGISEITLFAKTDNLIPFYQRLGFTCSTYPFENFMTLDLTSISTRTDTEK